MDENSEYWKKVICLFSGIHNNTVLSCSYRDDVSNFKITAPLSQVHLIGEIIADTTQTEDKKQIYELQIERKHQSSNSTQTNIENDDLEDDEDVKNRIHDITWSTINQSSRLITKRNLLSFLSDYFNINLCVDPEIINEVEKDDYIVKTFHITKINLNNPMVIRDILKSLARSIAMTGQILLNIDISLAVIDKKNLFYICKWSVIKRELPMLMYSYFSPEKNNEIFNTRQFVKILTENNIRVVYTDSILSYDDDTSVVSDISKSMSFKNPNNFKYLFYIIKSLSSDENGVIIYNFDVLHTVIERDDDIKMKLFWNMKNIKENHVILSEKKFNEKYLIK